MERFSWKDCESEKKSFNDLKNEAWEKTKEGATKVKTFWDNNWQKVVVAAPIVLGGIAEARKIANDCERRSEAKKRESRVYDPAMGDWWDLKKPLTNNERLELESRVAEGELRGNVLREMGKLRK